MIKIRLNEIMCLTHVFILSNLTVKLEGMAKVVLTSKLNDQNGPF